MFYSKALDIKSFVPTGFYVSGDVPNIQNKVLNGNTSLEEALLYLHCVCFISV